MNPAPIDSDHRHPLALLTLLGLTTGCVSTTTVPLGTEEFAAYPKGHRVAVYDAVEDLPRPWVKIARIRAQDVFFGDVFGELRAEARRLGADAMVLLHEPLCRNDCSDRDDWSVLVVRWK